MTTQPRKSQFARTLEYFRTGDIEEVKALLVAASTIINERTPGTVRHRTRQPKHHTTAPVNGTATHTMEATA